MGFTKSSYDRQLTEDQRLQVFCSLHVFVCERVLDVCLHVLAKWALLAPRHEHAARTFSALTLAWFYDMNRTAGL